MANIDQVSSAASPMSIGTVMTSKISEILTATLAKPAARIRERPHGGRCAGMRGRTRGLQGHNHPHDSVTHSGGGYVRGLAHTAEIDSHWAMLKRGITGTYHHILVKHLVRYAGEFAGRHNDRPMDTAEQMRAMAHGMVGRRLRYEDLIAWDGMRTGNS